ncbi:Cro/Cl family transcriptional regulator [Asticcacaulis sp. AC466]|uniref:helix-turn-helix domain-containing protein n=1 Tax=Asticcacaulis sp. AC466 TaxID=1282362 RepID=UPI0003C3B02C|nr:helix-turn-helix transcriptional regulator [Asticcacaulis sp. AC466]ESQ82338.1 Cro/Cl family transcriptional regulator [Asticcacaulis sp. AC466]
MKLQDELKAPDPVDIHVGARVRMRRKSLGLSQEALAERIGLTFQQVQKYERGSNRISCSKLYAIASVLKAPAPYFFEGIDEEIVAAEGVETETAVAGFLLTTEGFALARAFPRIPSAILRRRLLSLVETLSVEALADMPPPIAHAAE